MPRLREQVQQIRETQEELEAVREHIHRHKDAYLFGTGVLCGVLVVRLFGSSQVVVVQNG